MKNKDKTFLVPVVHSIVHYACIKAPDRKTAIEAARHADSKGFFGDIGCIFEDYGNRIDKKGVAEVSYDPTYVAVEEDDGYTLEMA